MMSGPPRPGDPSGTFASALGCTVGHRGPAKWVPESDALGSLARPFGSDLLCHRHAQHGRRNAGVAPGSEYPGFEHRNRSVFSVPMAVEANRLSVVKIGPDCSRLDALYAAVRLRPTKQAEGRLGLRPLGRDRVSSMVRRRGISVL